MCVVDLLQQLDHQGPLVSEEDEPSLSASGWRDAVRRSDVARVGHERHGHAELGGRHLGGVSYGPACGETRGGSLVELGGDGEQVEYQAPWGEVVSISLDRTRKPTSRSWSAETDHRDHEDRNIVIARIGDRSDRTIMITPVPGKRWLEE